MVSTPFWSKRSFGFTLIELLIVIAIILILISIALPNFMEAQIRARLTSTRACLHAYRTANEAYNADFRVYIPDVDGQETEKTTGRSWASLWARRKWTVALSANCAPSRCSQPPSLT